MTETSFSNCLNKLDTIIFNDEDKYVDENQIRDILKEVREFIVSSIDKEKIYNKQAFMLILQFINYLIELSYESLTNTFINYINGLRFLIIKFRDNKLHICNREIDFRNECNSFLCNIINNNGFDYYNEEEDITE